MVASRHRQPLRQEEPVRYKSFSHQAEDARSRRQGISIERGHHDGELFPCWFIVTNMTSQLLTGESCPETGWPKNSAPDGRGVRKNVRGVVPVRGALLQQARSSRANWIHRYRLDASGHQATSRRINPVIARSRLKWVETPTGLGHNPAQIAFGSIRIRK